MLNKVRTGFTAFLSILCNQYLAPYFGLRLIETLRNLKE